MTDKTPPIDPATILAKLDAIARHLDRIADALWAANEDQHIPEKGIRGYREGKK